MLDPVIVASGQTYERQSIQKWLDHGLNVCPKTHQRLTHANVIPNYTIKSHVIRLIEDLHMYAYFIMYINQHILTFSFISPLLHFLFSSLNMLSLQ